MFNFFSTNPCGVKISDSAIEVMELSEDRVVETYGRKLLAGNAVEDGEILKEEEVVESLRQLIDDIGMTTERAVLTLPASKIELERIDFEEELSEKEIKEEITERMNGSSHVDYMEIESEGGTSVFAVTVEKEVIEAYSDVLEEVGLEVVRIEPEQLALGRALLKPDGESRAIINLDPEATTLSVFGENNQLKFFRGIDFSGKELTQAIADEQGISLKEAKQLKQKFGLNKTKRENEVAPIIEEELESFLEEIEDEIGFYETNYGRIGQVILSGRTALVPGFGDYMAEKLGKMVQMGNPMINLKESSYLEEENSIHPVIFASVVGLSLSEVEDYKGEVNLLTSISSVEAQEPEQEEEESKEEEEPEELKEEAVVSKSRLDVGKLIKGAGITLLILALGILGYLFVPDLIDQGPEEVTEEPKEEQEQQQQEEEEPTEEEQQQEEEPEPEPEEEEEPEPVVKTMVDIQQTPTGWLRVRSGPGTDNEELDKVEPGESFPLASQEGDWYEIELPYGNGWVYGEYIKTSTTTVSQ